MKLLISVFALTLSLSAIAKDSIDLIIYHLESFNDDRAPTFDRWKYAKVNFPRKYYDEMKRDRTFTLTCYSTLDKGVQMTIGQGQIAVFHQNGERGYRGGCSTPHCQNSSFEDFESIENEANNDIKHADGKGESTFWISSVAGYNEGRNNLMRWNSSSNLYMPTVEEMPYVTLYSPIVHGNKPQVKNSFHCYLGVGEGVNRHFIEPF